MDCRKEQLQKQREYLKNKKLKKQGKMKELEEAREVEKSKWQAFNAKVYWTCKNFQLTNMWCNNNFWL